MTLTSLQPTVYEILHLTSISIEDRLSKVCEYLQENVNYYDWVGFYFANEAEKTLHLKAYAGEPTDHTVIPFGKGICGQVAISNQKL